MRACIMQLISQLIPAVLPTQLHASPGTANFPYTTTISLIFINLAHSLQTSIFPFVPFIRNLSSQGCSSDGTPLHSCPCSYKVRHGKSAQHGSYRERKIRRNMLTTNPMQDVARYGAERRESHEWALMFMLNV